ncbi:hypothetical protein [Bradyrhizobium sp. SZCCHNRI2007]|uniref:hypothetical protein n=1 Tax=Bradyrhizobium sp. SZCCHNRI2007 TaxID=3057281 RepID=UPI0028E93FE4|nr:hypothetical protein [Bradyrhizobium sp. SZCCHNRI2007]
MTDLVVQLGARLDQFAADMNKAGDLADGAISRIEGAFSSLNPGFGGLATLGTALAGATGSLGAMLAGLKAVNAELAEIGKLADYVGVSTDRLQQIKFGATQGGVSSSDANADLKHVADLLADAKNNENSLTKILDANNIKYRDRNGAIMDMNGFLKAAGELIGRFDSIPEKTKAAQMLGLSAGWVDALKGGPAAFEAIAASANAAGVVIDGQTIAKARNFDEAWKKSADQLGLQFKAVTADVASWLDDLVDRAAKLMDGMNRAANIQPGSGQTTFNAIADSMEILRKDAAGLPQDFEQLNRVIEHYKSLSAEKQDPALLVGLEEMRDKAQQAANALRGVELLKSAAAFPEGVPLPSARPAQANEKTGTGVIPSRKTESGARDQFDTSVDQVTKRTATLKADTAAVFQNNAAQAQFRAEFQELTAIMRDNGEVTQEQIDKYEALRGSMSAQEALTAAGITLTKEHSAAFLSSSQSIAQATAAYDAAAEKLRNINSASSQIGSALSTAFADAVLEGKKLDDVLSSLLKTLAKQGINSLVGSIFNAPASGGLSPFASVLSAIIPKFADGTDSAPGGLALVGERGPELVNLPRGAQVYPNAVTKQMTSGAQISNVFHVAGDVSPGTINRLQSMVVSAHRKVDRLSQFTVSNQRLQATGVG